LVKIFASRLLLPVEEVGSLASSLLPDQLNEEALPGQRGNGIAKI
jgi:hypothetical protein